MHPPSIAQPIQNASLVNAIARAQLARHRASAASARSSAGAVWAWLGGQLRVASENERKSDKPNCGGDRKCERARILPVVMQRHRRRHVGWPVGPEWPSWRGAKRIKWDSARRSPPIWPPHAPFRDRYQCTLLRACRLRIAHTLCHSRRRLKCVTRKRNCAGPADAP